MTNDRPGGRVPKPLRAILCAWRPVARRLQLPEDGTWLALVVLFGSLLVAGILAAAFVDPEKASWFPQCTIRRLTGLECPGCGTGRAIHAAAHGHWRDAFRYNPILVLELPLLVVLIACPRVAKRKTVAWAIFALAVGWMAVRNLAL